MARLAQGDEQALADLHRRWAKPLLNFLVGMCGDRILAEDLTQEVLSERRCTRLPGTYKRWLKSQGSRLR